MSKLPDEMPVRKGPSRRRFMKAAATSSIATAGLAGCVGGLGGGGGGSDRTPMDVEEWPPENLESQMNLWNWYDDWASWAAEQFGEEFDVDVSTSGYSSPDQWYSKLQAGNQEMDNISATTNWVERSIENDFLHELPVDIMPAWENIKISISTSLTNISRVKSIT